MGNSASVTTSTSKNVRSKIATQRIVNAAVGMDSSLRGAVKGLERKAKHVAADWAEGFKNENRSEKEEKKFRELLKKYPEMYQVLEKRIRPKALDLKNRVALLTGENLEGDTFGELWNRLAILLDTVTLSVTANNRKDVLRLSYHDLTANGDFGKTLSDLYFKIINNFGQITNDNLNNAEGEFTRFLMGYMTDLTDMCPLFAYQMEEFGILDSLIQTAADASEKSDLGELLDWIVTVLSVIYNCAKAGVSKQFYKKHNTLGIIQPFIRSVDESTSELSSVALMTMAYLIDEEDAHLLQVDDKLIDYLMDKFVESLENEGAKVTSDGWSLEELTAGLTRLASNDKNKRSIVNKGILPYVIRMTREKDDELVEYALQLLWILSFNEENKKDIRAEEGAIQALENWSKSGDNPAITKASQGALWNLGCSDLGKKDSDSNGEKKDANVAHIMISYQWDVQKLVLRVRDELKKGGYKVWMDVDEMGGSTLQAMAEAVEGAAAVLVFMSSKYKDSPNCRAEGEYAFQTRKDIVPILVERGYKANGWLGPVVGAKFYIDMTAKVRSFETYMDGLFRELGDRGREGGFSKEMRLTASTEAKNQNPVVGERNSSSGAALWSVEKTQQWFKDNGLHGNQLNNLNGEDIVTFNHLRQEAPEFFYSYIVVKQLGLTTIKEIGLFGKALDKI